MICKKVALNDFSLLTPLQHRLPLGLLAVEEVLEDADNLCEGGEVGLELGVDLVAVVAELGVKVLAVRAGAHGSAEDGLDDEAVVRLEGVAVGGAERIGQLLGGVAGVLAQGEAGELEATMGKKKYVSIVVHNRKGLLASSVPDQPQETLGGGVLLGLELVAAEVLEVFGLGGRSQLAITDFLSSGRRSLALDY